MKHRAACGGAARKTVRATVIKSDAPPRVGLVCKVCASHGVLVVPWTIRMLPAKPKRVSKSALLDRLRDDPP